MQFSPGGGGDAGAPLRARLRPGKRDRDAADASPFDSAGFVGDGAEGGGGDPENPEEMSLSVTNNMDVLRTKLLRELLQRSQSMRRQSWINRNQQILASVGRRRRRRR